MRRPTVKALAIFQAVNTAQADEIPQLAAGSQQWVLERD